MEIEILGRKFLFFGNQYQWDKFEDFIVRYFLQSQVGVAAGILFLLFIVALLVSSKCIKYSHLFDSIALVLYLFFIFTLSIFNRKPSEEHILRLYFDPWFAGKGHFHESIVLLFGINLVYFFPYGFIIHRCFSTKKVLLSFTGVLVTAIIVELFQYILGCGIASIEDVLAYVVGGVFGIICSKYIFRKTKKFSKKK